MLQFSQIENNCVRIFSHLFIYLFIHCLILMRLKQRIIININSKLWMSQSCTWFYYYYPDLKLLVMSAHTPHSLTINEAIQLPVTIFFYCSYLHGGSHYTVTDLRKWLGWQEGRTGKQHKVLNFQRRKTVHPRKDSSSPWYPYPQGPEEVLSTLHSLCVSTRSPNVLVKIS